MALTPKESEFTSVNDRIVARQASEKLNHIAAEKQINLSGKQEETIGIEKSQMEADSWLYPIHNEVTEGQGAFYLWIQPNT